MSNGHGPLVASTNDGTICLSEYHRGDDYYMIGTAWTSYANFIDIRGDAIEVSDYGSVTFKSDAAVGIAARILRAAMAYTLPGAVENNNGEAVCQHPDYEAAMRFCDAIIGDDREVVTNNGGVA